MNFLEAFQLYRTRLELRTEEYRNAPEKHGAFGRMLASAGLHEDLPSKFREIKKILSDGDFKKKQDGNG